MQQLQLFLEALFSLEIKNPFSIWIQISSFSFFLAGNFSDLLIVRLCLSSAYVFLFLNSALGAPLWPLWRLPGKLQLDGVAWACLNLYVHITTVVRLLQDERAVLLDEAKQALWRLFYRTGGLSPVMFQEMVAEHCQVVTLDQGQNLDTEKYFYIIYKGAIQLTLTKLADCDRNMTTNTNDKKDMVLSSRKAHSGQLFDFRALGLLHEYDGIERHVLHGQVCSAQGATLFCFARRDMARLVTQHAATRLIWKELLMENLLRIVRRYFIKTVQGGTGYADDYVSPLYAPLDPDTEAPHPLRAGSGQALKTPLRHVWASMQWSFAPPWPFAGPPKGLRHSRLLPRQQQKQPQQNKPTNKKTDGLPTTILHDDESKALLLESIHKHYNNGNDMVDDTEQLYLSTRSEQQDQVHDEIFFDYLNHFDEKELGGMHLVAFQKFPAAVALPH